ncbi:hypothetical protein EDD37DRAFT_61500 [Exophiala viscosa]|uniref:Uncharacterized protein n=1 Tax=Exophiala viscosa TaxID=2486360 RepID=A0AAN6E545_9EURO|nr:hypothetical protein EDD36DRAFT_146388 [Exophiala viscosa]KAI1629652.1 hypothetical protein EDD37DRAFT_61500 [Exophiala viscosa]
MVHRPICPATFPHLSTQDPILTTSTCFSRMDHGPAKAITTLPVLARATDCTSSRNSKSSTNATTAQTAWQVTSTLTAQTAMASDHGGPATLMKTLALTLDHVPHLLFVQVTRTSTVQTAPASDHEEATILTTTSRTTFDRLPHPLPECLFSMCPQLTVHSLHLLPLVRTQDNHGIPQTRSRIHIHLLRTTRVWGRMLNNASRGLANDQQPLQRCERGVLFGHGWAPSVCIGCWTPVDILRQTAVVQQMIEGRSTRTRLTGRWMSTRAKGYEDLSRTSR